MATATKTGLRLQLVPKPGRPDFLDLPWHEPLDEWESDRLAVVARGIGRHVVRFVEYDGVFYALKELPHEIAHREYRLLRALNQEGLPAVEAVGIVHRPELEDVLITRYLEFSLPYRLVLARKPVADVRQRLLEALAELLVNLHLAGFFWGDCSLSNTLFRRDAGSLVAYLVDLETGERHETLSDGVRLHDLAVAQENLMGELMDLEAELGSGDLGDPEELGADVRRAYERLWAELTEEQEFTVSDSSLLADRLQRLNERGFDVDEFELEAVGDGTYRLTIKPQVVDPGHHRRRLLRLTGLDAQENQARRLLQDIEEYRQDREAAGQPPVSDAALAGRWLTEVFEPTIAAVPRHKWTKRQPAQLYHELLEHRWYLSEKQGKEVPLQEAIDSYLQNVLPEIPDERTIIVDQRPSFEDAEA
jgi:tRNA A-37 threonylcarbamoyl transferase component Bud32